MCALEIDSDSVHNRSHFLFIIQSGDTTMGQNQSTESADEDFMTLKGGKIKNNTRYKAKRRGSIWIPLDIYVDMSKSPTRLKERMIWRALTKSEILEFMKTESRNHKIKSNDSKLKLIRQWINFGRPDKNMLINEREQEHQRKVAANEGRNVQFLTLVERSSAIAIETGDWTLYEALSGSHWFH